MRKLSWWKVTILVLGGLVALFYWNEWRVEWQWQHYVVDARKRGVKLLLTDFAQPSIPAEENFAVLPMWTQVFAQNGSANPFKLPDLPGAAKGPPGFGDPIKGESMDWVAWQTYFQKVGFLKRISAEPARDVLSALDHYAPQFEEWNRGQSRPKCRFPLDLAKGAEMPLPHLPVFQSITKLFALRLRAHLALGDTTAALMDFRMALQGYHRLANDPTMISGLVRVSMLSMLVAAVGDGLRDRAWGDAELREIQAALGTMRLCADYGLAMESEHGFLNTVMDSVVGMAAPQRGRYVARWLRAFDSNFGDLNEVNSSRSFAFALIPRSIFRQNQLRANHYLEELLAQADVTTGQFDPDRPTPSALSADPGDWEHLYYFAFARSEPVYAHIERWYILMQTRLDHARLVCALERYRMARGTYPENLTDLVPEFIAAEPRDVYARAPYHYQSLKGKSFRLYGVGENRQDDGGTLDRKKSETRQPDDVWLYAPPDGLAVP